MMKKKLALLMALALALGALLPGLAEAVDRSWFIPNMVVFYYNGLLQQVFHSLGAADPEGKAAQYQLGPGQELGTILLYTSKDGAVEFNGFYAGGSTTDASAPADTLTLTVTDGAEEGDFLPIAATLALAVSKLDPSADFSAMVEWLNGLGEGGGIFQLNGYMLLCSKNDRGRALMLMPGGSGGSDGGDGTDSIEGGDGGDVIEAPAPEPTEAPAPRTPEGAVLTWEGLSLVPARYSVTAYSDGYASLKLYFRILNDTDDTFWVDVDGITVDGEDGVHSTSIGKAEPRYDSGKNTSDFALVTADTDDGLRAIVNARNVKLAVVLKDEHFDRVYSQDVTLDLSDLEGSRDVPEDFPEESAGPTEAMHYSDEYKNRSSADYRTLCEGDTGEDVKRLQQALIDLGYLNDVADGEYGPKTAAAVQALNEANGLGSNRYADAVTQDLAFSGLANPYTEPWVPLIFQEGARGEWKNGSKNRLGFRVKVTNSSRSRTIKAFELSFYTTDVWGDKVYGDTLYVGTTTKKIKPGKSAFSEFFLLPDRDRIATIWCGVSKVIFTDGEVRENSDINYWSWTYK